MSLSMKDLEALALELDPEARVALAQRLLRSVDSDPTVAAAWEKEIEARVEALDAGLMDTVAAEEVFAEARRILRR